ncbi:MAG: replicative DNA helicase [Crocinitomicaceae bacterium]|nr:replicative DNA helicase [Crocinitomicaceae bacterium]
MSGQDSRQKRRERIHVIRESMNQNMGIELGKLPPQAIDLEEAVLGAMMLEQTAVNTVIDILKPESFYKDQHGRIYSAIMGLFQKGEPIDILTVTQALRKAAELELIGGPLYISQLTNRIASTANIETHARIIAQKHIQRELIRISNEIIKDAYEETTDVFDLLDSAENNLFQIAEGNIRKNYDKMSVLIKTALDQIEIARKNTSGVSGVPSGFTELDRVTGGWQRSDMIIVAARPGMGKTAFVLSMARNMAVEFQIPVAVFSLEMSSVQLVQRLIASETELDADKLRKGNLQDHEYHQLHQRISRIGDAPIFIDDTPGLSVFELRAKCRRLKAQHGIQMVIIDYLQLMTTGGENNRSGNREQEISTISRSIKQIAKELDVPVIALSQLSRQVETRGGDKRPLLSDLRESGAIEQDADIVGFIYRPEYYGITTDSDGNSNDGIAEVIIAKHRNGALKAVRLRFIGRLAKFTNLEGFDYESQNNYGEAVKSNTAFAGENTTTITVSSKINLMKDDDEPFDYAGDEAPF